MATTEQFSLRWNNFHSNLTSGFHQLLEAAEMVDVTLAVEGHFLQAHKIVLSICSPYFKQMFKVNPCEHPIVIIKDVGHENMKDILEFMYMGEVSVLRENLSSFLRTAEVLQVKGLTGDDSSDTSSRKDEKLECENDDDSEILHYNPIEPEVELPSYVPPRIPSPPATSQFGTKRHTKGPNASTNSKRAKSEATPNQNKIKTESDVNIQNECNNEITLNIDENPNLNLVKTDNEDIKDIPKNTIWENSIGSSGSIDPNSSEQGKSEPKFIKHTYQCEKCLKKFSRRDHLRTHEKNIHGEDAGPFVCAICSQLYKNTESLRKHIAKFHFPKISEPNQKVEVNA